MLFGGKKGASSKNLRAPLQCCHEMLNPGIRSERVAFRLLEKMVLVKLNLFCYIVLLWARRPSRCARNRGAEKGELIRCMMQQNFFLTLLFRRKFSFLKKRKSKKVSESFCIFFWEPSERPESNWGKWFGGQNDQRRIVVKRLWGCIFVKNIIGKQEKYWPI